ncbi:MAG: PHP domain-containing protein [Clostridia bacterium]|nr:PHP domain-containing protein [Clostridia bacterium]
MSREYLLSQNGTDYRTNMHCHTTLSDGSMTPQEVKDYYKEMGYSIVAFTDHDVFIRHPELTDETFLALNGFEIEIHELAKANYKKRGTTHICSVALDKDIKNQPCYHRSEYLYYTPAENRKLVSFDESEPDFIREYNAGCVNEFIRKTKEKGFFVTYNHPTWSLENYEVYSKYSGMDALELINGSVCESGPIDINYHAFDDLLRQGKKIFGVGGDDNHSKRDAGWGWTYIRADKLTYEDVAKSLKSGNFYTSNGPKFKNIYIEDGKMFVECENVKSIRFTTAQRHFKHVYDREVGFVNKGDFEINFENDDYVRVTLNGLDGSVAFSNPYFITKEK